MKSVLSLLGSMKTMMVLMLVFAFAIGYATIVENDFGTMSAKAEIYNARWFEVLLAILGLNLIINIFRYKMYTAKKIPIFIFHIGFLVILLGATITRYVGYEGTMHIREGLSSSEIISSKTYFTIKATYDGKTKEVQDPIFLSKRIQNSFSDGVSLSNKKVSATLLEYIPNAVKSIVEDQDGIPMIQMMVSNGMQRGEPAVLEYGNFYDAGDYVLDFNSKKSFSKPVISIVLKDKKLYIKHSYPMSYFSMDDSSKGTLKDNTTDELKSRVLYSFEFGNFVVRKYYESASQKIVTNRSMLRSTGVDAFRFRVDVNGKSKELFVFGREDSIGKEYKTNIDGVDVSVAYGAKMLKLPFEIYLKDFQLDRYPGSMSPSSYASEVKLIDKKNGVDIDFRIYMNHILNYDGYRFFQASYDTDEKGTILSVNHDPGTLPTYFGYILLGIGMFWSLFSRKNRFAQLAKRAKKASEAQVLSAFLIFASLVGATTPSEASQLDPALKTILSIKKEHADKFSKLIVQDAQGRMKPMDTLSLEILAKIKRSSSLQIGKYKLDANQVVLGMMVKPDIYREMKIIRVGDKMVNKLLGLREDTKFASFSQFFDDAQNMHGYKLAEAVDIASKKAPKNRDKFDKAVLKIDERVNVVYMVFTGSIIKIWPKPNDVTNKWLPTIEALQTFKKENAARVRKLAIAYFSGMDLAIKSGDFTQADDALKDISSYQKKYGASVYPSQGRVNAEIFYNKSNIFEILWPLYFIMGFVLLILSFIKIIKPSFKMEKISKISLYLLILFFIAHTMGLALRWYISGHAPWSNGFESMTYIGWATVLAGFIFAKRSPITLASTAILTGLILFVAHLSWMNPQVTNLVPVLNSYWLSIHVSMITASYGFLGLSALLGFITLILFLVAKPTNVKQISFSIKELNAINEMSLMIGLAMLTLGNFLGGVWANESWGRYWGWDPKETWALVTILVYAVVIHVRFIKSIYNEFNFSVISLLSFTSVLMTYFGVNYYLAGMHSYAKGDPVPIPDFVPISYGVIAVVIALAYRNRKIA